MPNCHYCQEPIIDNKTAKVTDERIFYHDKCALDKPPVSHKDRRHMKWEFQRIPGTDKQMLIPVYVKP